MQLGGNREIALGRHRISSWQLIHVFRKYESILEDISKCLNRNHEIDSLSMDLTKRG